MHNGGLGKSLCTVIELAANVSLQFPVGEAYIGIPALNLLWNGQVAAAREHDVNIVRTQLECH